MLYFITRERYSEGGAIAMLVRHTLFAVADIAYRVPYFTDARAERPYNCEMRLLYVIAKVNIIFQTRKYFK